MLLWALTQFCHHRMPNVEFFRCANVAVLEICTYLYFSTNSDSLSLYVMMIVIISRCQNIIFTRMIQFR